MATGTLEVVDGNTVNVTIGQNETWNPTFTWRDSAGALVDLSGYSARLTVKDGYGASAATFELTQASGITLGGVAGTIAPVITATQLGTLTIPNAPARPDGSPPRKDFVWDLILISGAGASTRLMGGKFTVLRKVSTPP